MTILRPSIHALILIILLCLSFMRNAAYTDDITLYADVAIKSPLKERSYTNLGHALLLAGKLEEATADFERALSLNPDSPDPLSNLAYVYDLSGRTAASNALLDKALARDPANLLARTNLAMQYYGRGMKEGAAEQCRIIIQIKPVGKHADFARSLLRMIDAQR